MTKKKISNGAGAFLTFLVGMTNAYSVLSGANAGRGVWVSDILAFIIALFLACLFASACDRQPKEDFYGVMHTSVGKVFSAAFGSVFFILSLLTCIVSLTVFSRFVQITALPRTPQIIIPSLLIITAALSLSKELSAAGGAATLLFWFSIVVFSLFVIAGIGKTEKSLLFPQAEKTGEILKGVGEVFLNRFAHIPALMAVYTRMPEGKKRKKYFLTALSGSGIALAIIGAICVATLGEELSKADFYPVYTAMSVHSVGGFIQHTEIFACIAMTVSLFFKCAVSLMFAEEMINGITGTERKRGFSLPLALVCAALTQIIYSEASSLRGLLAWKNSALMVLFINVLLPVVLWISSRIKKRKTN